MGATASVLFLEVAPALSRPIIERLEDAGFDVTTASTLTRARYVLFESTHAVSVLLVGATITGGDVEAFLAEVAVRRESLPVVLASSLVRSALRAANAFGLPEGIDAADPDVIVTSVAVAFESRGRGSTGRRTPSGVRPRGGKHRENDTWIGPLAPDGVERAG